MNFIINKDSPSVAYIFILKILDYGFDSLFRPHPIRDADTFSLINLDFF